jgi:hypothetical protein
VYVYWGGTVGGGACVWKAVGDGALEGGMLLAVGLGCSGGVVMAKVAPHFQHTDRVGGFAAPQ